MSHVDEVI